MVGVVRRWPKGAHWNCHKRWAFNKYIVSLHVLVAKEDAHFEKTQKAQCGPDNGVRHWPKGCPADLTFIALHDLVCGNLGTVRTYICTHINIVHTYILVNMLCMQVCVFITVSFELGLHFMQCSSTHSQYIRTYQQRRATQSPKQTQSQLQSYDTEHSTADHEYNWCIQSVLVYMAHGALQ